MLGSHMNLVHLDGVEHGCCGPAARADAAEVARIAGFAFEIVDMTRTFEATVIDDFVAEHEAGRTPNPCARCNGEIKFGAFLRRADELGIDFVATGHYVRTRRGTTGGGTCSAAPTRRRTSRYMLHMLGQRELARSLFPIGDMPEVRDPRLAERFGLPVASKPDSQELCFAPSGDAGGSSSESRRIWCATGEVVDADGRRARRPRRRVRASRSASGEGSVSRPASPRTCSTSTPRRTASSSGRGELLARRGLSPTASRGSRARPPADGPFEAEVAVRYRGEDVPAVIEPDGDADSRRVPHAAARRRAGAERRRLPRRGAARRRSHRRALR